MLRLVLLQKKYQKLSNTFAGGMTENGYGSNWEYDKTTGVWSFKTTTTSQLAGETPVYDTPFKIGHNYINLKGSYVDDTLDLIPFTWETTTLISDLFARLDSYFSLSPNGFYASPGTVDDTILSMFGKYTGTRYEFYNPTRQTILVLEAGSVGAMATAGSVLIHRR